MDNHVRNISTLSDEPIEDATLFGFDKKSNDLTEFLSSDTTITPFVIAINGEWGSGKSSLLLTVKKKLEKKILDRSLNMKVVYFEAWKHEGSDPAASLVYNMVDPFPNTTGVPFKIAHLAIDLIAKNTLNTSFHDMKEHFDNSIRAVPSLHDEIKKVLDKFLKDGRLIVMIDDLDRCTIENTLTILNSMKLFLSIKQCLFVLAVDINKIELAWKSRYGNDEDVKTEGMSYLEKIFQMQTGVPAKDKDEVKKYVKSLVKDIPDEFAELLANFGSTNPRQIKRILNTAAFHTYSGHNKTRKFELSLIWIIFEHLTGKNNSIFFYDTVKPKTGHDFLKFIAEVIPLDNIKTFNQYVQKSAPFVAIGGLSAAPRDTFEFFKLVRYILEGFRDDTYDQLENSLKEIITSSKESNK